MEDISDFGHWEYPGKFDVSEWFGFIYRIIDTTNDREYIGKKQFHSTTTKAVKGKSRRKKTVKESDWKKYTSSSVHINEAIKNKGKGAFIFLIESLHKTKAALHYAEIEAQVDEDVLRAKLPNGERKFYNGMIANVKFLPPAEVPEETRHKIRQTLRLFWQNTDHHYYNKMTDEEKLVWDQQYRIGGNNAIMRGLTEDQWQQYLVDNCYGAANPMFGVLGELHHRFGVKHTDEVKKAQSENMKGRFAGEKNPRFGKSPHENLSEDQLNQLKDRLRERMTGENNPMFGIPCTYKMSPSERDEWRAKISKATKGRPKSEATKEKMRKPKGPQEQATCPHCGKSGGVNNLKRYHFEKCKHAPKPE